MKSFLVGLLIIACCIILSSLLVLLFPLMIVMGVLLRWLILAALVLFMIWLVGEFTLWAIKVLKKKDNGN